MLIIDHTARPFDPTYIGDYRIASFENDQVEIMPSPSGQTKVVHITDAKYVSPVDNIISKLQDYQQFG